MCGTCSLGCGFPYARSQFTGQSQVQGQAPRMIGHNMSSAYGGPDGKEGKVVNP